MPKHFKVVAHSHPQG